MRGLALVALVVGLAGCAILARPSDTLVEQGDRLARQGNYTGAVEAYDAVLARYPEAEAAGRARAARETVMELIAARVDIARLRGALAAREGELARLRQDLAARRAELRRVNAEAERLRADLEQLKRIDLREERRRR